MRACGNVTESARCDVRVGVHARLSDEQFREQRRRELHSRHQNGRLKYMADEPQDADEVVQVQYEQTGIIDVDVE